MTKFLSIVRFEVGLYLRRISTWAYTGILFALGLFVMAAIAGVWDSVSMAVGGGGGVVNVNSPFSVLTLVVALSIFGVLITAALFGNSSFRDYESGMYPLFFTSPITRFEYLGGRFVGALIVNAVILLGVPLGIAIGAALPMVDEERIGPFRLAAYIQPYLFFVLPTLVFTGAIFFALAVYTRKMLSNYLGAAVLLVAYMLAGQLVGDIENRSLAALLDPFGGEALGQVTQYWTPAQRNTQLIGFGGMVMWNRLLWMAIGLGIFGIAFARFRFAQETRAPIFRRRRKAAVPEEEPATREPAAISIPDPVRHFGPAAHFRQYLAITSRAFREVILNRYFYGIVGTGLLFLVFGATEVGKLYGTETWPVTYNVIELLGGSFSLFILIIITFYAGDLVWRERDIGLGQVYDASPMPNWVPLAAKFTGLIGIIAILQFAVVVAGILTQALKGYFNFEIGLYLKMLLGLSMIDYALLAALVMLVHVVVNHKYMGHLIVILYFVFTMVANVLGFEHQMYSYGSSPGMVYSDMNGFGPFLAPYGWFSLYWAAWALLFGVLSNLFWLRGEETGARWRLRLAKLRFQRPALGAAALAIVLIGALGGFIFYNTNVLNDYVTTRDVEGLQARYEKAYKQYEGAPQPRVVDVDVDVEIYPERAEADLAGRYWLRNDSGASLDTLYLMVDPDVELRDLTFGVPVEEVQIDREMGFHIYRLPQALVAGDSITLDFDLRMETEGFGNTVDNLEVVANGTFLNSRRMPIIGYVADYEIGDNETRRKHDLPPRDRMRAIDDPEGLKNSYISQDADLIRFAATVGTTEDQIAVAPGYLQREWNEDGRRYFRYEMDTPIWNFYSFLSAVYEVRRDSWNDVAIEVFYHPTHTFNIDRMVDATKRSLDYYTANFGPYQHRQVRILEFPRYASFAQSFPNTIPFSEAIGFVARVGENDIDYPFYVTAHEVAHQWWAHQVIGANVQGSTVLVETMAQYSALMVMEEEFGREHMGRFLEYEMDQYLSGRAFERQREQPLMLNESQGYIHYNKGAVVMYALRDYIGEDVLNRALARFLRENSVTGPPYPTARDLYRYLEEATPDSLQSMLNDLFREITIWDLRTTAATSRALPDGRYEVTLELENRKLHSDSIGNEVEVEMEDAIDIGVFGPAEAGEDEGALLYLGKHPIRNGEQTISVIVDGEPARAGVDPQHKLIDRISSDNVRSVEATEE